MGHIRCCLVNLAVHKTESVLSSKFCTRQSSVQSLWYSTGSGHVSTVWLFLCLCFPWARSSSHSALGSLAARDEAQGHSGGTALGIEESRNWFPKRVSLLKLAAIAKIRISLLLSFLRNFQRCTDRASDKAAEVDRTCFHGLPYAARNGWKWWSELILSAWRVANNLFLMLVDEQDEWRESSSQLSSSVFQELQADDACDMSLWREIATCCALITAWLSLSEFSWKLSSRQRRHHGILRLQLVVTFVPPGIPIVVQFWSCWTSRSCKVLR